MLLSFFVRRGVGRSVSMVRVAGLFSNSFRLTNRLGPHGHHRPRSQVVAAMIMNERQRRITRAQAEKFKKAIAEIESVPENQDVHPMLHIAQIDALKSQLGDLQAELREYEDLQSGARRIVELGSFEDLPRALVQARIAAGLSQRQLATKLGIKEQQVQRYEATDYQSASLARVSEVVSTLGLSIRAELSLPARHVKGQS